MKNSHDGCNVRRSFSSTHVISEFTHMCVGKELFDSYCETISRITETAINIKL